MEVRAGAEQDPKPTQADIRVTPTVSVIITHHLDSCRPYLDACLRAVVETAGIPFEIILVSSSETRPVPACEVGTHIHDRSLDCGSKKWTAATAIAHPKSDFFLFLSDDVMVCTRTLLALVGAASRTRGIVSPFAQAEHTGRFIMEPPRLHRHGAVPGEHEFLTLTPDMSIDQIEGWHEQVIHRPAGPDILSVEPWVPFYAPLIHKSIWERVGGLDPMFESRHNDQDYCSRAAKLGIPSVFCMSAPVLHFGSRTIRQLYTTQEQNAATIAFYQKQSQGG